MLILLVFGDKFEEKDFLGNVLDSVTKQISRSIRSIKRIN
jgi:hypothetical protein